MKDLGYISSILAVILFFVISLASLIIIVFNYLYAGIIILLSSAFEKMADRKEKNTELALIVLGKITNGTNLFMAITLGVAVFAGLSFFAIETKSLSPIFITLNGIMKDIILLIGTIMVLGGIIGIFGVLKMNEVVEKLKICTPIPHKDMKRIIIGIVITVLMGITIKYFFQGHLLAFSIVAGLLSYKSFEWYYANQPIRDKLEKLEKHKS